jgi:hypothetical protein
MNGIIGVARELREWARMKAVLHERKNQREGLSHSGGITEGSLGTLIITNYH